MNGRRRIADAALVLGTAAAVVSVPLLMRHRGLADDAPWLLALAVFLAAATYTRRRLPDDPAAAWFAFGAGTVALTQSIDGFLSTAIVTGAGLRVVALLSFTFYVTLVLTTVAMAHLIGLFPDGHIHSRAERLLLRAAWGFLAFPPLVLLARPRLLFPTYYDFTAVVNPFAVGGLAPVGEAAAAMATFSSALFGVGVLLLILRYRHADTTTRRRIRWLLLPAMGTLFAVIADVVFHAPGGLLSVLYIGTMVLFPMVIVVALLRPSLLDIDVVLRKSLVYGLLWITIAAAYVAAAASLGVAAGQRFSVGMAITLTVVATLLFQPARRWLERLADRWVFGARTDPARLITRLGAALEETVEEDQLLPRMETTLREGLGLTWARVRLEPSAGAGEEPALVVPIIVGDERVGVVECGPKTSGPFTPEDAEVVKTLARQAALAVRNVRLTAELEQSRTRLVRAQDAERRRIERNIHDGVQQDLVALMAHAAHTRGLLARDPDAGGAALTELQEGLRRVNTELRELAHGIHPSVLGDRGLLEAVEALASRSNLPVAVRADPALRGLRFAEEVEGASYFTVAEALANVSKHASATHAEVRLARSNGSLEVAVHDDGTGFSPWSATGEGLANLAARVAALGGRLDVVSAPGEGTTVTATLQVSGA